MHKTSQKHIDLLPVKETVDIFHMLEKSNSLNKFREDSDDTIYCASQNMHDAYDYWVSPSTGHYDDEVSSVLSHYADYGVTEESITDEQREQLTDDIYQICEMLERDYRTLNVSKNTADKIKEKLAQGSGHVFYTLLDSDKKETDSFEDASYILFGISKTGFHHEDEDLEPDAYYTYLEQVLIDDVSNQVDSFDHDDYFSPELEDIISYLSEDYGRDYPACLMPQKKCA